MHDILLNDPVPDWFKPVSNGEIDKHYRYLPHWKMPNGTYFITFRQADSISRETYRRWIERKNQWLKQNPKPWKTNEAIEYKRRFSDKFEKLLDAGYGSCLLRNPDARALLRRTLLFFDGKRFHLDSFVIMPNHVHILVAPIVPFRLSGILHSWKSYSSQQICGKFDWKAPFWLEESWDHLVRTESYFLKYRNYIQDNPVNAGLKSDEYTLWQKNLQAGGL